MAGTKGLFVVAYLLCLALFSNVSCGQTPNYQQNVTTTANWTTSSASTLPDSAIIYTADQIMPYYSNLAAIGLVRTGNPVYYPKVKAWMQWYVAHLNYPDKWGLSCTVYDYNVSGTTETPTNDADSTDSYAATFVSLAWAYWQTGDATALDGRRCPADELESVVSRCHSATVPGAVRSSRSHKHPSEESLQHFQYKMAELDKPEVPRRLSVGCSLGRGCADERHDLGQQLHHHHSD